MATLLDGYLLELIVDEKTMRICDGGEERAWEMTREEGMRMMCHDIDRG